MRITIFIIHFLQLRGYYRRAYPFTPPEFPNGIPLKKEDYILAKIFILICLSIVCIWILTVLYRRYFIRARVKLKMQKALKHEDYWNYDNILNQAKDIFLQTLTSADSKVKSSYSQLVKGLFNKNQSQIKLNEKDIRFNDSYIISFTDKNGFHNDKVSVFIDYDVIPEQSRYKIILQVKRIGKKEILIEKIVRNPTLFMLANARTFIEKR